MQKYLLKTLIYKILTAPNEITALNKFVNYTRKIQNSNKDICCYYVNILNKNKRIWKHLINASFSTST